MLPGLHRSAAIRHDPNIKLSTDSTRISVFSGRSTMTRGGKGVRRAARESGEHVLVSSKHSSV
jgi:hypothetical protein